LTQLFAQPSYCRELKGLRKCVFTCDPQCAEQTSMIGTSVSKGCPVSIERLHSAFTARDRHRTVGGSFTSSSLDQVIQVKIGPGGLLALTDGARWRLLIRPEVWAHGSTGRSGRARWGVCPDLLDPGPPPTLQKGHLVRHGIDTARCPKIPAEGSGARAYP
jgi:hypothetical protein